MKMAKPLTILLMVAAALTAQEAPAPAPQYSKDSEATQPRPLPGVDGTLWMNPLKWTWVKSDREDTAIYFHSTGRAQARLVGTAEGKPAKQQLADTLERIRKLDPTAHVGFEEERVVNGTPMLCAQIVVGEAPDKEIVYYGYLFGDEQRSVQLFTIARRPDMGELYIDLTSLLNGLEIPQGGKAQ